MSSRSKAHNRCDRCLMRQVLCLCTEIRPAILRTRVTLLMHWREKNKTTNTGNLARLALPNSEIQIRGDRRKYGDAEGLINPEYQPMLLYSNVGAIELSQDLTKSIDRPIQLIVPDGNWRQARKMVTREAALHEVICVKLPEGAPSIYSLRASPHIEKLSTFEAISRAIGIIEGPEIQKRLDLLFELMVERSLWSRGRLKKGECKHPIPQKAFDAFYLDGCNN